MFQQQVYIINTIMMVLDGLCIYAAGCGSFYIKYFQSDGQWTMTDSVFGVSVIAFVSSNNYAMGKLDLYSGKRPPSVLLLVFSVFEAIAFDFAVLSVGIFLYKQTDYSREFLLLFSILSFCFIAILRITERWYINNIFSRKRFNTHKILVVGNRERGQIIENRLAEQLSWGHEVLGRLTTQEEGNTGNNVLGKIEDLLVILREHAIDEVIFALSGSDRSVNLSEYLEPCKKMGVAVKILPSMWKPDDRTLSVEMYQSIPFLTIKLDKFDANGILYKRILDLTGGIVGVFLFLVMYPFIAAAIKFESKGPVLFKQKRIGQNGRVFQLYKFRSMCQDAEARKQSLLAKNKMDGPISKFENDPRITRVGDFLRKTSLDEFPQFMNVIKGEMSLVGTRPPTLDEVEKYEIPHLRRISAKPGITGLWQVSGRSNIEDFDDIVKLDCEYLDSWRFWNDIKILWKTVLVVLQRSGAE